MRLTRQQVAELWATHAFLKQDWRLGRSNVLRKPVREGQGGGSFAASIEIGRAAYLKPYKCQVYRTAAHEKLASDLAYLVGVTVPPVVLTNTPSWWSGQELICASLVMFQRQTPWGCASHGVRNEEAWDPPPSPHVRHLLKSASVWKSLFESSLSEAGSRAYVFDAWVAQPDHNHSSNIIWGMDTTSGDGPPDHSLVFLDYEMAFGVAPIVGAKGWGDITQTPFPQELLDRLNRDIMEQTINRIQRLPEEQIIAIVSRLPDKYLKGDDKENIITHLLARRADLPFLLSQGNEP